MLLTFITDLIKGNSSPKLAIAQLLISVVVIAFALSAHELSHGLVALWLGDTTARDEGRISLNPFNHFSPLGTLCMLVFGFGWAKPVPINVCNFKNKKAGMALSSIAGPITNILLGILNSLLYGIAYAFCLSKMDWIMETTTRYYLFYSIIVLFTLGALYNFIFAIFNLIPIPPFDGSRVLFSLLPEKAYFSAMKYERILMFVVLIAMLVLSKFDIAPFAYLADKAASFFAGLTGNLFLPIFS